MTGAIRGFAVVDVETTGLSPRRDRIVEIAIVHVDPDGSVVDQFCTLVDPQRDVGPTRVHGLTASSVVGAPVFSEAAPAVCQRLAGRVFVAHNARFDLAFVDAELRRCGLQPPPPPVLCTMALARRCLRGLTARTLAACCEAAGVELVSHHSALDDALAAAGLLACYLRGGVLTSWEDQIRQAAQADWPFGSLDGGFRPVTRAEQARRRAAERPPLADLVHRLQPGSGGDVDNYLAVLDRVLEDRLVTGDEVGELFDAAEVLGIARDDAAEAHREFLAHVGAAAWADGVVTEAERADFMEVAGLVDVDPAEAASILDSSETQRHDALGGRRLLGNGDRVVFTGDMVHTREELEQLATDAGLFVTGSVSSKTAVLVTADPHSQSGKARRARELGIRTVTEQVFLHLVEACLQRG